MILIFLASLFHFIHSFQNDSFIEISDGITKLGPCTAKYDDGTIFSLSKRNYSLIKF